MQTDVLQAYILRFEAVSQQNKNAQKSTAVACLFLFQVRFNTHRFLIFRSKVS